MWGLGDLRIAVSVAIPVLDIVSLKPTNNNVRI